MRLKKVLAPLNKLGDCSKWMDMRTKKPRIPEDFVDNLGTRKVETADDWRDALPEIEQEGVHIEDI